MGGVIAARGAQDAAALDQAGFVALVEPVPPGKSLQFGAWFQVDDAWYSIVAYTDPLVRQYTGPGTYQVNGAISPYAPLGAAPIFEGLIQLTVTSDKRPGPQTGTLRGTMTWTGASSPPVTINISGGWTCTFSTQLGPG